MPIFDNNEIHSQIIPGIGKQLVREETEEDRRRVATRKNWRRVAARKNWRRVAARKNRRRVAARKNRRRVAARKDRRRVAARRKDRRREAARKDIPNIVPLWWNHKIQNLYQNATQNSPTSDSKNFSSCSLD